MKFTNIPDGYLYSGETCFLPGSSNLIDYLHGGFDSDIKNNTVSNLLSRFISKYGNPHCGRNRATFLSKYCCFKIPLNADGEINNKTEDSFRSPITSTSKLLIIDGIICLMQEKLTPVDYDYNESELTEWSHLIECGQIGFNRKGVLKAFDYAEADLIELTLYITSNT